jgi:hypothetical protein
MVLIVSRDQWGAVHPDGYGTSTLPAGEVWLHHSVTVAPDLLPPFDDEHAAMRTLERIGHQRFGRGISYTFAVMPTGRIYEGHSVEREGAHTAGRNDLARAIVWVGNYDVDEPTPAMVAATAQLLAHGQAAGWWTRARLNGGHRQAPGASTACPGINGMAAVAAVNDQAARGGTQQEETDMYDQPQRDELVTRLDKLLTAADSIFRTVNAVHAGVNDPKSGTRALVLQLAGRDPVDVDEDALARALAPLLIDRLPAMAPGELHELAAAVVTEQGRRLASYSTAPAPAPSPAPLGLLAAAADTDPEGAHSAPAPTEEPAPGGRWLTA